MKEYPTLTALMQGREPGSVKVRGTQSEPGAWFRPGCQTTGREYFNALMAVGTTAWVPDKGPWLIVEDDDDCIETVEYVPAFDILRVEIAARVLAGMYANPAPPAHWSDDIWASHALAEADALIAEARK